MTVHPTRTRTLPSSVRTILLAAAAVGLLAGLVPGTAGAAPAASAKTAPRAGRLLIVSLPGVTWADVRAHHLANIERFASTAAVADLAPRSVHPRSGPGDAYLTISGGSRAETVPGIDGQVLGLDEQSSGSRAGDIFTRRTGVAPVGDLVSLTWPSLLRTNADQPYETEVGLLADSLTKGRVSTSVIANADGTDSIGDSYERQAGLALARTDGVVSGGALGKDLLRDDVAQPFGVRLDPAVVESRFDSSWDAAKPSGGSGGGVVLVEGSDLARALRYRPIVDRDRYDELWADALDHTDELLGRLLRQVDPAKDSVLLVAPYNAPRDRDLTMVALHRPSTNPGFLRSASTQRSGYLTLVDIAPTILDGFGLARPTAMEGRPAEPVRSGATGAARTGHLITLNRASRFRENLLTPTTTLVVLAMTAILALTIAAHANRWRRRVRSVLAFAAVVDLTVLPASYLARLFALERHGVGFYWGFLLIVAFAIPALATVVAHRRSGARGPLVAVLVVMALVLIGDVVTGSRLSLDSAFGYSATGNSRLYGISNYSYGQLAAATCLIAAWIAAVRPGRQGRILAVGAMAATLVVLGVPTWGGDVGGVLAFTPAVGAFAMSLTGRRFRLRTAGLAVLATGAAIGAFGLLDLARPANSRGHLGRLFERIGAEGPSPVIAMVQRKLAANLEVSTSSLWVLAIPICLAFWIFLRRFPNRPYEQVLARFPTLRSGLVAALVAGVLGSALNDSGAIIGGVMATVVAGALAVLVLEGDPPDPIVMRGDDPDQR